MDHKIEIDVCGSPINTSRASVMVTIDDGVSVDFGVMDEIERFELAKSLLMSARELVTEYYDELYNDLGEMLDSI